MSLESLLKSTVCATCLSAQRNMFPVKKVRHLELLIPDIKLSVDDRICWECEAITRRMFAFKSRALQAQLTLAKVLERRSDIKMNSLSSLTTGTPVHVSIVESKDVYIVKENVFIVAEEPFCEDTEIKSEEIKMEVEVKFVNDSCEFNTDTRTQTPVLENTSPGEQCDDGGINDDDHIEPVTAEANVGKELEGTTANGEEIIKIKQGNTYVECYKIKSVTEKELLSKRDRKRRNRTFLRSRFKCDKCLDTFIAIVNLREHMKQHSMCSVHKDERLCSEGRLTCHICELVFCADSDLQAHTALHYRIFECCACAYTHIEEAAMVSHHQRQHHPVRRACRHCDAEFTTEGALRRHWRQHAARAACDACGHTFKCSYNLRQHMRRHTGEIPSLECEVCHKTLRGESGLRQHMKTHTDKMDEAAYCAECGIQFKSVYSYRNHLKITLKHNPQQDREHKCPHCDKRFASRTYLQCHVDAIHDRAMKYACGECSEAFKTTIALRRHKRAKHEGFKAPKNKMCHLCGKGFNNKATLSQHINTHTGARPYVCPVCGDTFGYSGALYTHKKLRHSKDKVSNPRRGTKGRSAAAIEDNDAVTEH